MYAFQPAFCEVVNIADLNVVNSKFEVNSE